MRLSDPSNYKTQSGLLKAVHRLDEVQLPSSKEAWWVQNCIHVLVTYWGWDEKQACRYVHAFRPHRQIIY